MLGAIYVDGVPSDFATTRSLGEMLGIERLRHILPSGFTARGRDGSGDKWRSAVLSVSFDRGPQMEELLGVSTLPEHHLFYF